MKALALMPRGVGIGREEFRRYYESQHVPLALRYFRFRKYVRNHVTSSPEVGFDCVSEFWPLEVAQAATLMQGAVGERMHEDERQFADQARIVSAPCRETRLAGAPRRDDETGIGKVALLLRSTPDGPTLLSTLQTWAAAAARSGRTITLDEVIGMPQDAFPCDAILWLHAPDADLGGDADPQLPANVTIVCRTRTRAEETPAATLSVAGKFSADRLVLAESLD
ncbi:MAG: EthD domain-containing protein [Candidatus Binatia bacterium]